MSLARAFGHARTTLPRGLAKGLIRLSYDVKKGLSTGLKCGLARGLYGVSMT